MFITRSTDIAARNLDGEMIIMSTKDSVLFTLNGVATAIWEAADGKTSLEEIIENKICAEYDIDPATALRDARELAQQLEQHGLVHLSRSISTVEEQGNE